MSRSPVLDRCPKVLRPHRAEDGLMVRLRLPGGRVSAAALVGLGHVARCYGHPALFLTSRCGLQLRGLPEPLPAELSVAIADLGLLPSITHEQARSIVCSPLTGISGGLDDLSGLTKELDEAIRSNPELAGLSGRFLFALDDGRADVVGAPFDLAYLAQSRGHGTVLVGNRGRGVTVSRPRVVATMIDLASAFLAARPDGGVWHVRDLPDWVDSVTQPIEPARVSDADLPLGEVGGAASVLVPLGVLEPHQLEAVAAAGRDHELRLTPDRGVIIPGAGGALSELAAVGLITDRSSSWSMITACVGAPGCARTRVDTRAWARSLVAAREVTTRTHLSGCERRCGAPARDHVDLVGAPPRP